MSAPLPSARTLLLVVLAMLAFAGNSLLCRLALKATGMDAGSFTGIRLAAGALVLGLLLRWRPARGGQGGDWPAATALFVYAAAFSYAYLQLEAGAGALLLFGAVQVSMTFWGLLRGERLNGLQSLGFALALGGLASWLLPGASAPPIGSALLMLLSGVAWGVYSLLGRRVTDPLVATAGNFLRAVPLALVLMALSGVPGRIEPLGVCYAALSGGVTSGIGYALWYAALRGLTAIQGASVQLSVPVLAALGGALLLGEAPGIRLLLAAALVLGGVALLIRGKAVRHAASEA